MFLVGAGACDLSLIMAKSAEGLRRVTVVMHDGLVNRESLHMYRTDVERNGRLPHSHPYRHGRPEHER